MRRCSNILQEMRTKGPIPVRRGGSGVVAEGTHLLVDLVDVRAVEGEESREGLVY